MEQGWVYILVNSSIPGLAKIGRTVRCPAERAAELSAATGVATAFVVAFEQPFADCAAAEHAIHRELDRRGLRAAPNREFFRGSTGDLVRVVLDVAAVSEAGSPVREPPPSAAALLARGDAHLHGTGEALQDLGEAVRFYRLAAARGSVVAFERLGAVFASLRSASKADHRRATMFLREGARRGNYYCYCEMAWFYALHGHVANFTKAWDLFFARRAEAYLAEAEAGDGRYALALRSYVAGCLDLRLAPAHMQELKAAAADFIESLSLSLQTMRQAPGVRHQHAVLLRWSYENLLAPPATPPARPRAKWFAGWHAAAGRATA